MVLRIFQFSVSFFLLSFSEQVHNSSTGGHLSLHSQTFTPNAPLNAHFFLVLTTNPPARSALFSTTLLNDKDKEDGTEISNRVIIRHNVNRSGCASSSNWS